MTVKINKPALNLREELNELNKPSGITGESLLRADTDADARATLGIDNFEQVSVSTDGVISADGLTSSGNLLVGKTSPSSATVGFQAGQDGFIAATRASAQPLVLNRTTNDGIIADFRKNGTNVGNIGTDSNSQFMIGSGDTGLTFQSNNDAIIPRNTDGTARTQLINLGTSGAQFKDLYLSGTLNGDKYGIHTEGGGSLYQTNGYLRFANGNTETARIDSSGNVGIGVSNVGAKLDVLVGGDERLLFTTLGSDPFIGAVSGANSSYKALQLNGSDLKLLTNGSEKARIDASGNLLVGTTETAPATNNVEGIVLRNEGHINVSRASGVVGYFNRKTNDGTILSFHKDGTSVGSIGSNGNRPYFASTNCGIRLGAADLLPATSTGVISDNVVSLGSSAGRWKNLYLSGGVYLGGTGAANKLDDYEEGTWTPVPSSGTTNSGLGGQYIKIGSLVHIQGQLSMATDGTTNRIDGLPFRPRIEGTLGAVHSIFTVYATGVSSLVMGTLRDTNNAISLINESRSSHNLVTADGVYSFAASYYTDS